MATKSDFAQKLLNDLRLKKEGMAASQSSSNSNMMARDGHRNSRQNYEGSQKTKAPEPVRPNTVDSQRRASGSTKENSRQLVTYGSGQRSEQRGSLPMAFMLALQNGGKYGKKDSSGNSSMLHFLQQIGRRSLDAGNMDRSSSFNKSHSSTSQFPTFSHFHINEISKGVQNLNQILRACSNGLNFDKYSIEVGKELLKGAVDLEESLKMLVNLQEASEYMIKPQRKNRITLLDEDEDDEANNVTMAEQKQLDLPRFSFDKRSRNSHGNKEVTKADLNQRLIALTYNDKTPSFHRQQTLTDSNSETHWRPASWGPEPKSRSNSSKATPEKGRMSSVIAKLMGLEVLPERADPQMRQKESGPKQREGIVFKTTYTTTKNAEAKTRQTERLAALSNNNNGLKQDHKVPQTKNFRVSLKAEKVQVSPQRNSVEVVLDEHSPKNFERAHRTSERPGHEKATSTTDKPRSSHSNHIPENQKNSQEKEKGQDSTKHKQQKSTENGETKEVIKDELQRKVLQKHRSQEAANILQEKIEESTLQTEKINSEQLIPRNQQTQQDNGLHQLHMLPKSELQEEKHHAKRREQQNTKPNTQATTHNGRPVKSKVPSKTMDDATKLQKKQPRMNHTAAAMRSCTEPIGGMPLKEKPDGKHDEDFVEDEISKISINGNLDENSSPKKLASQVEMAKDSMLPLVKKKPVHILATGKKVEITRTLRDKTPRKINEPVSRRNGTLSNLARPSKHHNIVIQESRQRRKDKTVGSEGAEQPSTNRSKEGEGVMKESNKLEASTRPQNHNVAEVTMTSNDSQDYECGSPKAASPLNSTDIVSCSPLLNANEFTDNEVLIKSSLNYTTLLHVHSSYFLTFVAPSHLPSLNIMQSDDLTSEACMDNDHQRQASVSKEYSEQKSPETLGNPLDGSMEISYPPQQEKKKAPTSWTQELLTENEKHLKEILIKSPLFLNTAEALFKLNIPVGILHASDQIYQEKVSKLTIDCAYEVINRKGRRQELSIQPCLKVSISYTKVRSLDDLVKQLYKDFERLKFYGRNEHDDCDTAENLLKMLERDIKTTDPNINCMWDFGWNEVMFAYVETDDIIKDVEGRVLDELIEEIIREL